MIPNLHLRPTRHDLLKGTMKIHLYELKNPPPPLLTKDLAVRQIGKRS